MIRGSNIDLERLIVEKRSEIEKEKFNLGLSPPPRLDDAEENSPDHANNEKSVKRVAFQKSEKHDSAEDKREKDSDKCQIEEEKIPPDLERYIRRYIGLPGMLKAGEFSPNNPLVRSERIEGDALLGLGEYERRRHTLRRLRQQQYREYLDLQAKKKQEEKEKAENERREREERERLREEERERARQQAAETEEERRASVCYGSSVKNATNEFHTKTVDTGVQVSLGKVLSVGVQTDDGDLYGLPSPSKTQLTQAERELSPRTVVDQGDSAARLAWAPREKDSSSTRHERDRERRRSYGDFDERPIARPSRERLLSDLRHTRVPSILDAEAIRLRNLQAEQEAAARRLQYQEELRNQIKEQQRIREERRTREKMLEQAEMRRLEEQLRMLKAAQDREHGRQRGITTAMKENATDYDRRRISLQKEIDYEKRSLRTFCHPSHAIVKRNANTSHTDSTHSQLPFYYPKQTEECTDKTYQRKLPFSTNIPENSIFSHNYDVDSYLRKNLNPSKESLMSNRINSTTTVSTDYFKEKDDRNIKCDSNNLVIDKALVHDFPKENGFKNARFSKLQDCPKESVLEKLRLSNENREERKNTVLEKPRYEPSFLSKNLNEIKCVDETPIPVLRHSPKNVISVPKSESPFSDQMKKIDDKWKVPAVQKNILKSLPGDEGKNVSILTQLGSIRRQLQLEQLRLDNMIPKGDV